jgi:hypothetical protein
MGSTQPLEYNWRATWRKSSGPALENREYEEIFRGDYALSAKVGTNFADKRLDALAVRSRTEFSFRTMDEVQKRDNSEYIYLLTCLILRLFTEPFACLFCLSVYRTIYLYAFSSHARCVLKWRVSTKRCLVGTLFCSQQARPTNLGCLPTLWSDVPLVDHSGPTRQRGVVLN